MKSSKLFQVLCVGLLLSFQLAACAGSDTMMQDDTMEDKKMEKMEMEKSGMKDDSMMHELPKAMLSGSKGHHAAGKVSFSQEMGKTKLVLSELKVDKVPDGHVYLAKNGDRKNGIDLGILRQFTGKVDFVLPPDTDPEAYDSVIIHCEEFNVEIGRAVFSKSM